MQELDRIRKIAYEKVTNNNESEKLKMIVDMLSVDNVFFEIDMDTALNILNTLEIDDPILEYEKLIDIKEFKDERVEVE